MSFSSASLFPITARVNTSDHLAIGGCDVLDLVAEYGTPLYLFDEETLRNMCRQFVSEFERRYVGSRVLYAAKAFMNLSLTRLVKDEGLGMDVVSGGELAAAKTAGFPLSLVYFHGNNKTAQEIQMAMDLGVGRIVVDNFHELALLQEIAQAQGTVQKAMLRVSPSVDPHTHTHTTTGILDSKFGFSMETGDAAHAIRQALTAPNIDLTGLHFHLGSPIFELEPYSIAINAVLTFAAKFKALGLELREFSPGGGFAIGYLIGQPPPSIASYADVITSSTKEQCAALDLGEPSLIIEPGRSIVGRAGVAIYSVGAVKDIPAVRKYVSLDGGMGDNIRPALYDAPYEAVVANKMSEPPDETVTLAGKFCESGDILVRDINLSALKAGDVIAIPASGAYAPSMASNYNLNPRPPVIMVKEGSARLIRRRETYSDMMACDVVQ